MGDFLSVGLAAPTLIHELLKICESGYHIIHQFRATAHESKLLLTRFENQGYHLQAWGEITGAASRDWRGFASIGVSKHVLSTLCAIAMIVSDTRKLRQRYGVQDISGDAEQQHAAESLETLDQLDYAGLESWTTFKTHLLQCQNLVVATQKRMPMLTKLRWALVDRARFKELIDDLKSLNDDLFLFLQLHDRAKAVELSRFLALDTNSATKLAEIGLAEREEDDQIANMATLKSEKLAKNQASNILGKWRIGLPDLVLDPQISRTRCLATWRGVEGASAKVLVEWKVKGFLSSGLATQTVEEIYMLRIQKLVQLLASTAPQTFKTLSCLGYHIGHLPDKVGMIYRLPPSASSRHEPKSLAVLLHNPHPAYARYGGRVPLESRFRLAAIVSQALGGFHQVNWLHKRISAENIIFFHTNSAFEIDIESPYVTGFDFSRDFNDKTLSENHYDMVNDRYRHPKHARGAEYRKSYDIYAVGLVLLEIAFWTPLETMAPTKPGSSYPGGLWQRQKLIDEKITTGRLRFLMGSGYDDAVRYCLGMEFEVEPPPDERPSASGSYFSMVVNSLNTFSEAA